MDNLSKEKIDHVALLARLKIQDNEYESYNKELKAIWSEIEKILKVEIEGNDFVITTSPNQNCYKEDNAGEMLSVNDVLKNAKNTNGDYISVPKVLND